MLMIRGEKLKLVKPVVLGYVKNSLNISVKCPNKQCHI